MRLKLPAVNEPIIRVLVDTTGEVVNFDFNGERPQEVEIDVSGVDVAKCPIGYVAVGSHGQEVGEPVLLWRPEQCPSPSKSDEAGKTMMGKEVVVAPNVLAAPEKPVIALAYSSEQPEQPSAEAPPESVKVEEKVDVKTTRKGK